MAATPPVLFPRVDGSALRSGERQVAETLEGIDQKYHVERYVWADDQFDPDNGVWDIGCGCGYGSEVLDCVHYLGLDNSGEAISFAARHYGDMDTLFLETDVERGLPEGGLSRKVAIAFEIIEHVENSKALLASIFRELATPGLLLCSVPQPRPHRYNADRHKFHVRDWTPQQITEAVRTAGFTTPELYSQMDSGEIVKGLQPEVHTLLLKAFR